MNQLQQLKQFTTVVADHRGLRQNCPVWLSGRDDQSVADPEGRPPARAWRLLGKPRPRIGPVRWDASVDALLVRFGNRAPEGRAGSSVHRSRCASEALTLRQCGAGHVRIMTLYEDAGIPRDRVLIKLGCDLGGNPGGPDARAMKAYTATSRLVFAFCQAVTCGDANVTLISPFVGRIYDWYKHRAGADWNEAAYRGPHDPGVKSVAAIYTYFKRFGVQTLVMGASCSQRGADPRAGRLRFADDQSRIAGGLQSIEQPLPRALIRTEPMQSDIHAVTFNESSFRYALNDDSMAHEKLAEGIRNFAVDALALEQLVAEGCA